MIVIAVIAVAGLLGGIAAVFFWGIYARHWDGPVVASIANVAPIPAARVGNRVVLFRDYLSDVRSIERFLSSEDAKRQGLSRPPTIEDRRSAIDRLMEEAALMELAEQRNLSIGQEEVTVYTQQAINEFAQSSGRTAADIEPYLRETYDWSLEDFQKHIVKPALLMRILTASYAADHGGDNQALRTYLETRLRQPDVVRYLQF
jgi:hypothetical protein